MSEISDMLILEETKEEHKEDADASKRQTVEDDLSRHLAQSSLNLPVEVLLSREQVYNGMIPYAAAKEIYDDEGFTTERRIRSFSAIRGRHHLELYEKIKVMQQMLADAKDELDVLCSTPKPVWSFTTTLLGSRAWDNDSEVMCYRVNWKVQGDDHTITRLTNCDNLRVSQLRASRV
jgi:hypothetical protein